MTRRYSIEQLLACLAAAEANWARACWADVNQWKRSIHALRDRIAMELSLPKVQP